MPNGQLHITLIQPDMVWENKKENLAQYSATIASIKEPKHIVALPEMFTTGFSMEPERLAEPMDGASVQWMVDTARTHRCIITGSLIIEDNGKYYNRMLWVQPDGAIGKYDKRHLFAYGHENEHYTPGATRLIAQVNGWRINLQVCYDLRFPVWSRNLPTGQAGLGEAYDVLLYVANWPRQRSLAWKTLLQARAMENMCYVVGVNRVGADPKGNTYTGDSSVFGPLGETLWQETNHAVCHTVTLDKQVLEKTRTTFPFLKDADNFMLL